MITVDRIENGYAVVLQDGKVRNIPILQLPNGVREGSVLRLNNGEYCLDIAEEKRLKKAAFDKTKRLFK
ncbi:MAG: DUF3006 domain-containing protein [Ruminococcaceae bacterium]|nr:DUF3006 domain-containing protein [Oscillospiraceae bacterium]